MHFARNPKKIRISKARSYRIRLDTLDCESRKPFARCASIRPKISSARFRPPRIPCANHSNERCPAARPIFLSARVRRGRKTRIVRNLPYNRRSNRGENTTAHQSKKSARPTLPSKTLSPDKRDRAIRHSNLQPPCATNIRPSSASNRALSKMRQRRPAAMPSAMRPPRRQARPFLNMELLPQIEQLLAKYKTLCKN